MIHYLMTDPLGHNIAAKLVIFLLSLGLAKVVLDKAHD